MICHRQLVCLCTKFELDWMTENVLINSLKVLPQKKQTNKIDVKIKDLKIQIIKNISRDKFGRGFQCGKEGSGIYGYPIFVHIHTQTICLSPDNRKKNVYKT